MLKVLFQLANTLTQYLHDKQLLDAGQAMQLSNDLRGTLNEIQRAHEAKLAVKSDADSVRNDLDNRDRK